MNNMGCANGLASFSTAWAVGIQSWQLDILTGAQLDKLTGQLQRHNCEINNIEYYRAGKNAGSKPPCVFYGPIIHFRCLPLEPA